MSYKLFLTLADATKRNRGRRGLDILKEMQDANKVAIEDRR